MALCETDDYLSLFLRDTPLIDTRAPVEFARGAFPSAVNLPLMTDSERAEVGTCYKREGQQAAIELGHRLVNGEIKQARVQAWRDFARDHADGYLYCFRGGLRSQICQQWLAEAGCDYPRVRGGYKAMRRFLIDSLETVCRDRPMLLVAGHTGAAKTELLNRLPQSVDLEQRANHRGSAFGRRVGGQPAQIDFENAVSIDLLRRHHRLPEGAPVVLEDESHLIGRCYLPQPLRDAMARALLVVVDTDIEDRVEHTFANYILHKLAEWQDHVGEQAGFDGFADDLRHAMQRIRKRLGGVRHAELAQMLEAALAAQQRGNASLHRDWIRQLLTEYYDPMYNYQLGLKHERIAFRGTPAAVLEYLTKTTATTLSTASASI